MAKTSPKARLSFLFNENGFELDDRGLEAAPEVFEWQERFRDDPMSALYDFGFADPPEGSAPSAYFLHNVSAAFTHALTNNPDLEIARGDTVAELDEFTRQRLLGSVPFAFGTQYITPEWLDHVFSGLHEVFRREMDAYDGTAAAYLAGKTDKLQVKERVFFHLVERKDGDYPFAFLATYSTKDKDGKIQHVPLQFALTEYKRSQKKLLELLGCLNRVSEVSPLIAQFVQSGEMFHPLRLTSEEAYQILKDIPKIEEAGVVCRIPNWWRRKSGGFGLQVKINADKKSFVGLESIVSTVPSITLDGEPLTKAEIRRLLAQSDGLAFIKGKWVEVNHEKLKALLARLDEWGGDLTLLDTLRMSITAPEADGENGPQIVHGRWLKDVLARLRDPKLMREAAVPRTLNATLRPYQQTGFTWLNYMADLGLGCCLADDMGLGKTVQVLAFLEKMRLKKPNARVLLVVPASLLGNWEKEKDKFAPEMPLQILHGKAAPKLICDLKENPAFLTITTYGMASRIEELQQVHWDAVILDEAQAIKNPRTKQSRQIRKIPGRSRIALTGTPVENDLSNLWAIFDFIDSGLLGSMDEFKKYSLGLESRPEGYADLRNMIAPFMLRRMKTDKNVIADLPEKLEVTDYVTVSSKQSVLYERVVEQIEQELRESDGEDKFKRSSLVLRSITKLKQICNHPSQYLGQPVTNWKDGGKFEMMRDICENIAANRERVLVFTQFKEITPYLDEFLAEIFGTKGFVIHGGVPVKKRSEIVDAFQSERYYPYVVLTVKAGGTGLNLTNANHVIHFDRWWNPAVENQATDRAFRIGQKKDVMVHKLICKGTIEEKIDQMIESKKALAENVVSSGENWISDLSDDELVSMMQFSR